MHLKPLILGSCIMGVLSGCLPVQQQAEFQSNLQALNKRLMVVEQRQTAQPSQNDPTMQLRNIARQQANLKAELDSLRVDLQRLSGRLEDQQHSVSQQREEWTLAQNDLSLRVAALETQPVTPQPPVIKPEATATPVVPVVDNTPQPQPFTTTVQQPEEAGDSAQQLYQQALQLVQQSTDFTQSRTLFRQFIQQYPGHELSINAMYWIGETLYGDKQYESAILQFQDVIQKHASHPKVPAALMKQGLAFYALGDLRNARIILQKVVESYPQTPEADKAKQRLDSWQ
ncbi:MAG: tol-pal system protein YbgF [Desulfuromonas sp.]|nr:tol-pal system protein YbgF [Desulfuromonas sp.]